VAGACINTGRAPGADPPAAGRTVESRQRTRGGRGGVYARWRRAPGAGLWL